MLILKRVDFFQEMANPNPIQSDGFKAQQFQAAGIDFGKLAKKGFFIRLPEAEDEALRQLTPSERAALMRQAIVLAVRAQLMNGEE